MSVLSIRNFPELLLRELKIRAAEAGMTLRDYTIAALKQIAEYRGKAQKK
jgi:plasmid stability protein